MMGWRTGALRAYSQEDTDRTCAAGLALLRMILSRPAHTDMGKTVLLHLMRLIKVASIDHDGEST